MFEETLDLRDLHRIDELKDMRHLQFGSIPYSIGLTSRSDGNTAGLFRKID